MDLVKRPLTNPVQVPLPKVVPMPDMFAHESDLHGQKHVSRVMIHAFLLVDLLEMRQYAAPLWASVYLHDLARVHDGMSREHGADAVAKLHALPELRSFFVENGVTEQDLEAVSTAVTWHSLPKEIHRDHPHWHLTALLKDADGLDRVRLGDLDPAYLRFEQSKSLASFAEDLYRQTHFIFLPGPNYFGELFAAAQKIWASS